MKALSFITLLILLPFSVLAGSGHLNEAIKHIEQAISAPGGMSLAQHAEEAKQHAQAAKEDKVDAKHLEKGITRLEDSIREGNNGNYDVARQEAKKALNHFRAAK